MPEVNCKCKVTDYHGHCIEFCPLHAAAGEMLEIIEQAANSAHVPYNDGCRCVACKARAILSKLTPPGEGEVGE